MILVLSVRLLDDRFHGRAANGDSRNWPPSCFRMFQAVVAGNARGEAIPLEVVEALKWLEALPPPVIIGPSTKAGEVVLTYVLNNSDNRSRTQKILRPTLFNGDRLIEFAWKFDPSEGMARSHAQTLLDAVRHIRAFGWGIDLAVGHGAIQDRLPESSSSRHIFFPQVDLDAPGIEVRVPTRGSMDSCLDCYKQYIGRYESNDTTLLESGDPHYQLWPYIAGIPRPNALFRLLDENGETARYPHARLVHIAGMVRHLALTELKGLAPRGVEDPAEWLNRFVRGKAAPGDTAHKQISYVPLPSIGHEHADAMIRNIMLVAPVGCERELEFVAQRITEEKLSPEGDAGECEADSRPQGAPDSMERFTPPAGKFINRHYLGVSQVWQSVTPVILDGHDDKKPEKTKHLIQLALQRAGVETPCEFSWQAFPYLKNCLSAHKYDRDGRHTGYQRPKHLKDQTAVHVRLTLDHPVPGPLTLGAGRHCGFGLLAAVYD